MAGAPRGKSTQGITDYKLEVANLVEKMNSMVERGKSLQEIYKTNGAEIERLRKKSLQLSAAMKGGAARAAAAAKNQKELNQVNADLNNRLRAINATYNELDRTEKRALESTRKQIKEAGALAKAINKSADAKKKEAESSKESNKRSTETVKSVSKEQKELNNKTKELIKLRRLLKKNGDENKNLKTKIDTLKATVAELRKELAKQNKELKKTEKEAKKTEKAYTKLKDRVKNAGKGIKGFGKGVRSAIGTLSRFATAGFIVGAAMKAFKIAVVDSLKSSVEFEKALANLAAVGGVAGKDLANLKNAALAAAGATKFTAIEVLGLQTELSKLGFTADDVVNSTKAIAIGAQALGADLSSTAEQVGKLINQFGLLAQDSDVIVDTLVTTINESALSLNSFGTAIQYIGPISRDLGVSLEETAGAMAVLADNGFTASRIGTGLRGILTELGGETVDVKAKLKDLAEENLSLSEAVDLVGKRNAAQLITLLNNIDVLDESKDKYYEQGRALEAAAQQATTFSGQMDLVRSAVNEAQIGFGDFLLEAFGVEEILGAISNSARETYLAFKLLKKDGAGALTDDLEKVERGMSAFDVALQRVAESSGKTMEEVREAFGADLAREMEMSIGGFMAPSGKLKDMFADFFGDGDLADTFQGYFQLLNEELDKVAEKNIIAEQRNDVDGLYQETLEQLIQSQREGNDVTKEATGLADNINKDRQALIRGYKQLEDEIRTNAELTDEEIKQKKELILIFKSQEKALAQYERRFANFVLKEEEEEGIARRRANTYKELERENKKRIDSEKRLAEIDILRLESADKYQEAATRELRNNQEQIDANNDLLAIFKSKRAEIIANIAAEDASTKQGAYNISVLEKEKEKLDELTDKYEERNKALGTGAESLGLLAKAAEKEVKALAAQYEDGDITGGFFKVKEEEIMDELTKNLKALAADNPALQDAVDTMVENIELTQDIDWNSILNKGINEAIDVTKEALSSFNDVALENTKNRLEGELEALKARYETEDYFAKQQFENNLINESQYRRRQAQLRKKQVAEENAIAKQIFEAEQKAAKNNAKVEYLEAVASIIPTLIKEGIAEPTTLSIMAAITAASATAAFASEMSAINQRKFFPKKFEQGGMVEGPSHRDGGVPFTVQGQSGYEMEGGEFIVNKRAASLHRDLLERINGSVKVNANTEPVKFANGGVVNKTQTTILKDSSESVDYLKVIAQATATAAMNSDKPVRAFVTSNDLRNDATARRIKDNNTTI